MTTLPLRATPATLTPADLGHDLRTPPPGPVEARVRSAMAEAGAVLLRGFEVDGTDDFAAVVAAFGGERLEYSERSTPRKSLGGRVYTSTDYAKDKEIFFHNENSYQASWPRWLYFYCSVPAARGGATPLADIREVTRLLDPDVRARFAERGWLHLRTYQPGFGLPWPEVFGTEDRAEVDRYCAAAGITADWRADGVLRTRARRAAFHRHPDTGESLWFNHIAFFHPSTLPPSALAVLTGMLGPDELPNDTRYGDGERIPDDVCAHLRDCYRRASSRFDYERGDVLLVDNMRTAHGREPYEGDRSIAVAMTGLVRGPA
ncbi:TauD/TfdA family dioxygenase [Amycolatopsis sp. PS_44_ISF1]|uniref:TauD/TfdA family dioxygenase n=1 Tax=Amycolatopsis sp. PS_44_ISF1 TaxID=2974917 RepID=UPI0028DD6CA4|nr:TauD/TfdA family dioxygenase [Amycolatopsis sp. PS_44_ISF1]MDT8914977.1 TauD/TfdA family dioxygenase [Amycolatopsis sp. PS_44_ISF1]